MPPAVAVPMTAAEGTGIRRFLRAARKPQAGKIRGAEAGEPFVGSFTAGEFHQIALRGDKPAPALSAVAAAAGGAEPSGVAAVFPVSRPAGGALAAGGDFAAEADTVAGMEASDLFPCGKHPRGNLLDAAVLLVVAGGAADAGVENFDQHFVFPDGARGGFRREECSGGGGIIRGGISRQNKKCNCDGGQREKHCFLHCDCSLQLVQMWCTVNLL